MAKDWIQSRGGKKVIPTALRPEQVSFEDIAFALSRKMRFSGQTTGEVGYSVAQHCVIGSQLIAPPYALAFLLHEVSEVYLPDVPKPVKGSLRVVLPGCTETSVTWEQLEEQHADVILEALGLSSIRPLIDCAEVKLMDLQMLALEKRDLMGPEPEPWGLPVEAPAEWAIGQAWAEHIARRDWLDQFKRLSGRWGP